MKHVFFLHICGTNSSISHTSCWILIIVLEYTHFFVEFCRDRRLRAFVKSLPVVCFPCRAPFFLSLFEPKSEWHPCSVLWHILQHITFYVINLAEFLINNGPSKIRRSRQAGLRCFWQGIPFWSPQAWGNNCYCMSKEILSLIPTNQYCRWRPRRTLE